MTPGSRPRGLGSGSVNYKLRDWLFSRQRYWGEFFPVVFDEDGVAHAVPESMLPMALPDVPDYAPKTYDPRTRRAPRSRRCRGCRSGSRSTSTRRRPWVRRYRRETNTMPNWAASCWYYLRYLDPANHETFCDPGERALLAGPAGGHGGRRTGRRPRPGRVDLYVGGVEHAVLHLLYARFWHKVLFDLGQVCSEEPFRTYFSQGTSRHLRTPTPAGRYVEASEVVEHPAHTARSRPSRGTVSRSPGSSARSASR